VVGGIPVELELADEASAVPADGQVGRACHHQIRLPRAVTVAEGGGSRWRQMGREFVETVR